MIPLLLDGRSVGWVWLDLLNELRTAPLVKPRGIACREHRNVTLHLDRALNNLFVHPARKLPYKFFVAEWLWIWFGLSDVKTIARYNPNIARYSDDDVTFFGAYGPRFMQQWPYVLKTLSEDRDSRQAIVEIWRQPSGPTKDVPCTLSFQGFIRDNELHVTVNMRSSDAWLGLPVDIWNFTMLQNVLAAQLGVATGDFTIHLGSSHLYEHDLQGALAVLAHQDDTEFLNSPQFAEYPAPTLSAVLSDPTTFGHVAFAEPWDTYARVLSSPSNKDALELLRKISR